jgi:hypothetical protein
MPARLARVLSRGGGTHQITERAVRMMVRAGYAQRWEASDGSVIISQLRSEPGGDVCDLWLAEGTLQPLLELHEQVIEWAKDQGCRKMRIIGRPGWQRCLENYTQTGVVLERDLWTDTIL